MMEQDKFHSSLLSKIATGSGHGEDSPYFDGWKAYDNDPFDPIHNPNGVIQMGLAENQLCSDMIEDWITRNPESSFGSKEGCSQFLEIANFQDYHGLPAFRTAVSKFMEKIRGGRVKFDPDRIVMSGGATGAHEVIAFCLADPGEAFLVPTPYYPGFDRDLRWRTGVQLFPIICSSRNNFQVTRTALESAYRKAQIANIKVKGVLITNPSNPLGTTINRRTLNLLFNFTNQHNLHLVCDEIYAGTTFKYPDFISISELMQEYEQNNIKFNPQLIHVVYSLSKDMGLPGFRIGIIYSYNDSVVRCARRMSSFGLVSTQTQFLIARMLSDDEFVDDFISQLRRRLAERKERFVDGLRQVGINCLESNAGLFCWMDLRKLLTASTEEEEIELWKIIINEVKLNVSPGSSFHCSEPGWFRVCFANMDEETMKVAMKRIRRFMFNSGGTRVMTKKEEDIRKEKWQASLRLSFSKTRRRYEEVILSPNPGSTMSPHSPLVPPIS